MEQPSLDPKTATMNELMGIMGDVSRFGANDSEPEALREIIRKFQHGECTAEEALTEARAIQHSKQDYH